MKTKLAFLLGEEAFCTNTDHSQKEFMLNIRRDKYPIGKGFGVEASSSCTVLVTVVEKCFQISLCCIPLFFYFLKTCMFCVKSSFER